MVSLKQQKDVPVNVSNGTIIMFHGASGVACKGGCKHTGAVLANIKDVRNRCTISPSGLNALPGKDSVCWGGEAIGKMSLISALYIWMISCRFLMVKSESQRSK